MAVILTTNKQPVLVLIDDEDFEDLSRHSWHVMSTGYVRATIDGRHVTIHRYLMKPPSTKVYVDHVNGDPLDNRKSNLRLVSPRENTWNAKGQSQSLSRFRGVSFQKSTNSWLAILTCDGVRHYIGKFYTEEDAALAYDVVARSLYGEYVRPNFPDVTKPVMPEKADVYGRPTYPCVRRYGLKWYPQVTVSGRRTRQLGIFDTELEAAECLKVYLSLHHPKRLAWGMYSAVSKLVLSPETEGFLAVLVSDTDEEYLSKRDQSTLVGSGL